MYRNFRQEPANYFELNPLHYTPTPGYSWNAMKKFIGVRLKLISNIEKCQFIESMITFDISMICKGYAEANLKTLKSYDPNKPVSYIIYLDANKLYEHSMMKLLPFGILDWIDPEKINLGNFHKDGSIG